MAKSEGKQRLWIEFVDTSDYTSDNSCVVTVTSKMLVNSILYIFLIGLTLYYVKLILKCSSKDNVLPF